MFRLPYRNFGTHEPLVIAHSVKATTAASAIRWYEIRTPNSFPTVFQKGTFGAGGTSLQWIRRATSRLVLAGRAAPRSPGFAITADTNTALNRG